MKAPTTVSLVHLGCARNLIDSELILARMAEEGCLVTGVVNESDVAVLNTCSFIGPAREESENAIRELLAKKRRGTISAVVVAGCLVQRYAHDLERRFPAVDMFSEISDYRALARNVRKLGDGEKVPRYLSGGPLGAERDAARLLATPGSYAYLRISHGCDHTCSFCAIPGIRGKHRSKPLDALREEARELIDAGVKELVLVAEDSTAWGRDLGLELPDLVEGLAELEGEHRLRVMYAYPNRFPERLFRLLREHERVVPYLDLPLQHISTPMLRAMRRAAGAGQVRRLLDRVFEQVPGITLRTTLLIGFPGETDDDAHQLEGFVREYRLSRVGAFAYSHEQDTPAHELPDDVPAATKTERLRMLLAARDEVMREVQSELIGSELEILVDEAHGEHVVGRSAMDAPEVDLVARIERSSASVGERILVGVDGLDDEGNLSCHQVAASPVQ